MRVTFGRKDEKGWATLKKKKEEKKKEAGERKEAKGLHFEPQLIAPISMSSVALLGYFSMAHGRWYSYGESIEYRYLS